MAELKKLNFTKKIKFFRKLKSIIIKFYLKKLKILYNSILSKNQKDSKKYFGNTKLVKF